MNIRIAKHHDIDAIYSIEKQCFDERAYSREDMAALLSSGWVMNMLCEEAGHPIGYCTVAYDKQERFANLASIAVLEGHRGKGCGTSLLKNMEQIMAKLGIRTMQLQVWASQADTHRFYQKNGYAETGTIKNYYPKTYGSNRDALVMQKIISK
jgi:ribosomal protein S18 acetylase RimI-like enzyme